MNFNSSNYFAYKKNKIQNEAEVPRKRISRFSFLVQLFLATFVVIFIIIVVVIMRYSSKMDIEYSQGELQLAQGNINTIAGYGTVQEEDYQRKIDKRLTLIQQEENAPSEAKIIESTPSQQEVISDKIVEKNKKLEKLEKRKLKKQLLEEKLESKNPDSNIIIDDVKLQKKMTIEDISSGSSNNVAVMSKVLLGRFSTFDEAKKLQEQIKLKNSNLQPFVRKVGNVYSVQMGSYQDFNIAKNHAQMLRTKGFDVWIYQQ